MYHVTTCVEDQGEVELRLAVSVRPEGHRQYHYTTAPAKALQILLKPFCRPRTLTAKICFDMVSGFGVLQVVSVLALLAFIQFLTRFIMWSWKLLRVLFSIPNAVSVSVFFPFDKGEESS